MVQYPGWNRDLRWVSQESPAEATDGETHVYAMGFHHNCRGAQSSLLLVREVAMMAVMDELTDRPNWHEAVADPAVVAAWTDEFLAIPDRRWWPTGLGNVVAPRKILTSECLEFVSAAFSSLRCSTVRFLALSSVTRLGLLC
jgi:hypothetical protein